MLGLYIIPNETLYFNAFLSRFAFLADVFTFARRETGEEPIEIIIVSIDEMKLPILAGCKA